MEAAYSIEVPPADEVADRINVSYAGSPLDESAECHALALQLIAQSDGGSLRPLAQYVAQLSFRADQVKIPVVGEIENFLVEVMTGHLNMFHAMNRIAVSNRDNGRKNVLRYAEHHLYRLNTTIENYQHQKFLKQRLVSIHSEQLLVANPILTSPMISQGDISFLMERANTKAQICLLELHLREFLSNHLAPFIQPTTLTYVNMMETLLRKQSLGRLDTIDCAIQGISLTPAPESTLLDMDKIFSNFSEAYEDDHPALCKEVWKLSVDEKYGLVGEALGRILAHSIRSTTIMFNRLRASVEVSLRRRTSRRAQTENIYEGVFNTSEVDLGNYYPTNVVTLDNPLPLGASTVHRFQEQLLPFDHGNMPETLPQEYIRTFEFGRMNYGKVLYPSILAAVQQAIKDGSHDLLVELDMDSDQVGIAAVKELLMSLDISLSDEAVKSPIVQRMYRPMLQVFNRLLRFGIIEDMIENCDHLLTDEVLKRAQTDISEPSLLNTEWRCPVNTKPDTFVISVVVDDTNSNVRKTGLVDIYLAAMNETCALYKAKEFWLKIKDFPLWVANPDYSVIGEKMKQIQSFRMHKELGGNKKLPIIISGITDAGAAFSMVAQRYLADLAKYNNQCSYSSSYKLPLNRQDSNRKIADLETIQLSGLVVKGKYVFAYKRHILYSSDVVLPFDEAIISRDIQATLIATHVSYTCPKLVIMSLKDFANNLPLIPLQHYIGETMKKDINCCIRLMGCVEAAKGRFNMYRLLTYPIFSPFLESLFKMGKKRADMVKMNASVIKTKEQLAAHLQLLPVDFDTLSLSIYFNIGEAHKLEAFPIRFGHIAPLKDALVKAGNYANPQALHTALSSAAKQTNPSLPITANPLGPLSLAHFQEMLNSVHVRVRHRVEVSPLCVTTISSITCIWRHNNAFNLKHYFEISYRPYLKVTYREAYFRRFLYRAAEFVRDGFSIFYYTHLRTIASMDPRFDLARRLEKAKDQTVFLCQPGVMIEFGMLINADVAHFQRYDSSFIRARRPENEDNKRVDDARRALEDADKKGNRWRHPALTQEQALKRDGIVQHKLLQLMRFPAMIFKFFKGTAPKDGVHKILFAKYMCDLAASTGKTIAELAIADADSIPFTPIEDESCQIKIPIDPREDKFETVEAYTEYSNYRRELPFSVNHDTVTHFETALFDFHEEAIPVHPALYPDTFGNLANIDIPPRERHALYELFGEVDIPVPTTLTYPYVQDSLTLDSFRTGRPMCASLECCWGDTNDCKHGRVDFEEEEYNNEAMEVDECGQSNISGNSQFSAMSVDEQ